MRVWAMINSEVIVDDLIINFTDFLILLKPPIMSHFPLSFIKAYPDERAREDLASLHSYPGSLLVF